MLKHTLIASLITAALIPVVSSEAANACGPSTAFENDDVKIWFQGFKGHFKIDNKASNLSYDVKTDALTESTGGTPTAEINLGRAFPKQTDTCTVETSGDEVTVTFSVTAPVRSSGGEDDASANGGNTLGEARVTYVVHFNTADSGSKFDLFVDGWPWQSQDGVLDFDFDLTAGEGTLVEPAENGVGFRNADAEPIGSFTWDPEFTARYADDSEQTGTVEATTTTSEAGSHADVSLAFTNVTSGYDHLIYDPWMGVGPYVVVGPLLINDGPVIGLLRGLRNLP